MERALKVYRFFYFFSTPFRVEVHVPFFKPFKERRDLGPLPSHCAMNRGGGRQRVGEHRWCSAAIHFIEVREIFLISSECSSFLLGLLMLNPLHIAEGNAPHDRGD